MGWLLRLKPGGQLIEKDHVSWNRIDFAKVGVEDKSATTATAEIRVGCVH